jgi:hypothetical protein
VARLDRRHVLALQHLSQAVIIDPEYPENRLLFGEALAIDRQLAEAKPHLDWVLNHTAPKFPGRAEKWRLEAERIKRQYGIP